MKIKNCKATWWVALLYGGSFMENASSICMGWIWYLQVEFWFYASFPINAILYNRNKALGKV